MNDLKNNRRILNYKVEKCATVCYGHVQKNCIELRFSNFVVRIDPKISWFKGKGLNSVGEKKSIMPFYELFKVFDMDCEDGGIFEDITGKECRVVFEGSYPVALLHKLNDHVFVEVRDLKNEKL